MQTITLDLPAMYGDHHVPPVRQTLLNLEGVKDVVASAARRKVTVAFDEAAASPDSIRAALEKAGYTSGPATTPVVLPKRHEDGSEWFTILGRITTTEQKDREMAGDFRRY
jgi:copper chaperone CopZ